MKIIAQATACLVVAQTIEMSAAWHSSSSSSANRGQARASFGVSRKSRVSLLSYAVPAYDDQLRKFSGLNPHKVNVKNAMSLPAPLLRDDELFQSDMFTISALNVSRHSSMENIMDASDRISEELGIKLSKKIHRVHTSMTSYLFPDAAEDRVVAANILFDLLYFIDDIFGEDIQTAPGAKQVRQEQAMEGKDEPRLEELAKIWMTGAIDERILSTLSDGSNAKIVCDALLWTRNELLSTCGDKLFHKISASLMDHLKEQLQPNTDYTDIDAYVENRRKFGGMYLTIQIAEYCYGCHITEDIMERLPTLQNAIDMCSDIGGLSNDVFSYPKESHSKLNLVNALLVHGHADSLHQAVSMSIDHVNNCHHWYILAVQKVRDDATKSSSDLTSEQQMHVEQFIRAMDSIVSASYHWQLMTQRYSHKDHILQDLRLE